MCTRFLSYSMQAWDVLGKVLLLCASGSLWGPGRAAEQSVTCVIHEGPVSPPEWYVSHNLTPSDLRALNVAISETPSGTPRLNISWTLSGDGSIRALRATFISLLITKNGNGGESHGVRCNYTEPFESPTSSNGQLWTFYHDKVRVKPDTYYSINAYNIPTANIDEDPPSKFVSYKSPGCKKSIMKYSDGCVAMGSLWNPNISACIIEKNVEVNFTLSSVGEKYMIQLYSCTSPSVLPSEDCEMIDRIMIFENNKTRTSVLIPVTADIANPIVVVYPLFPACQNFCPRHAKKFDCIHSEATEPPELVARTKFLIILLTLSFMIFGLAAVVYWIWKHGDVMKPALTYETGMRPAIKVLVMYPKESDDFQKTVLSFADFLHGYCKTDVILDMWQKRSVAEMGQVQWLVTQKEMADKIIFLSSSSRNTPQISSSTENTTGHKDTDHSESMFRLALNLFCSDLINRPSLHKYMVVYFAEINPNGNLPEVLRNCSKYCLMKDINLFCQDLHAIPQNRVLPAKKNPVLGNKKNIIYLQKLTKAVFEQKQLQHRSTASAAEEHSEGEPLVVGFIKSSDADTPALNTGSPAYSLFGHPIPGGGTSNI